MRRLRTTKAPLYLLCAMTVAWLCPTVTATADQQCAHHGNCNDGQFCNGIEICSQGRCIAGSSPCVADEICNESLDICEDPDDPGEDPPSDPPQDPPSDPPPSDGPSIDRLVLMDADADRPLPGFEPLPEGAVVDLAEMGPALSARADYTEEPASVVFEIWENGSLIWTQVESIPAFALFGNTSDDFDPWPGAGPGAGNRYDIKAVPYSANGGTGTAGQALTISFDVIDSGTPDEPQCSVTADCDDGTFCNGAEFCDSGACFSGASPCSGQICDEQTAACVDCLEDGQCDDGVFCNGPERCSGGSCASGTQPCVDGSICDEAGQRCEFPQDDLAIAQLTLINADTNSVVSAHAPLLDGAELNVSQLPALSVDATPASSEVGSVRFELREDGAVVHVQTESIAPYALFGDNSGNYNPWPGGGPKAGSVYEINAVPWSRSRATGTAGPAVRVTLFITADTPPAPTGECTSDADCDDGLYCNGSEACNNQLDCVSGSAPCDGSVCNESTDSCEVPDGAARITKIRLIDAADDRAIASYDPLADGDIINIDDWPDLNFQALTDPGVVDEVQLELRRQGSLIHSQTERGAPYALFGNSGSNYFSWSNPQSGNYTVSAVPLKDGASGSALSVDFTLVRDVDGPVADASRTDTSVFAAAGASSATAVLDGSASVGTLDGLVRWDWYDGGNFIGSGEILQVQLSVGSHALQLVVTDGAGRSSTPDAFQLSVLPFISQDLGHLGNFARFSKIEIDFSGPFSSVTASPNPFDIEVDVYFDGPGQTIVVPAFYDGDGAGGQQGNIWTVRFAAPTTGAWRFTSQSNDASLDGFSGTFDVTTAPQSGPDLLRYGPLVHVGEHYLKHLDGPYWIKAGMDDPENILGSAIGDWDAKKDAIDFISARGVNAIYAITNNVDGDRHDTWPWWGETENTVKSADNDRRFNVAKLAEWEDFFDYCESLDVVLHLILEDDGSWDGYDHQRYYREMVARFGHHPGILWNIGEESFKNYSDSEQKVLARWLADADPFDHPIGVHRWVQSDTERWTYIQDPNSGFDNTSIQVGQGGQNFSTATIHDMNFVVRNHRELSAGAGAPLPIMIDEFPGIDQVSSGTRFDVRRKVTWAILLGGGSLELHYRDAWGGNGSMTPYTLAPIWEDMGRALDFVSALPFENMAPDNSLITGVYKFNACLAAPGEAYGIYLAQGENIQVDLRNHAGPFAVEWLDVDSGATASGSTLSGGAWQSLGTPPFSGDVAVAIIHFDQLDAYRARQNRR